MKFNINNYVSFTLTAFGAKVWNARYDHVKAALPKFELPEPKYEGDVVKEQLWSVIQTFGETTFLGGEVFCKNCEIEFDKN